MACTVSDVLMRRTQIAFETRDAGRSVAPRVAELLAPIRDWDAGARAAAIADYDVNVERVFGVDL